MTHHSKDLPHYANLRDGEMYEGEYKSHLMLGFVLSAAVGFWSAVGVLVLAVRVLG